MGLDNPLHIAFLLILLLLVFGAKRLPEMGKSLGSGMRGFKDAISGESHESHEATTQQPAPQPAALLVSQPHDTSAAVVDAQIAARQPVREKLPA
jgi:sec-independent protein translocase protein TatA